MFLDTVVKPRDDTEYVEPTQQNPLLLSY
nr:hypothetical protein [Candidatus Rickettsia colombianensi]